MKHIIQVRRSSPVFGSGSIEFRTGDQQGAGFMYGNWARRRCWSVNNLSSAAQAVELDLRRYKKYSD